MRKLMVSPVQGPFDADAYLSTPAPGTPQRFGWACLGGARERVLEKRPVQG